MIGGAFQQSRVSLRRYIECKLPWMPAEHPPDSLRRLDARVGHVDVRMAGGRPASRWPHDRTSDSRTERRLGKDWLSE
jgi:hypothetical protein